MKNVLLVIIVLFSIKGFNQTEESEIKEVKIPEATMIKLVVDEFTDKESLRTTKESRFIMYKDDGDMQTEGILVYVSLRKDARSKKGTIIPSLILGISGISNCYEKGSTLDVIFENGEKTQLVNWNKFNCKGVNYMDFNKKQIPLFRSNKIKAVKYTNKKDFASMIIRDNMTDEINSKLMEILNEVDKINRGEMTIGLRKE